MTPTGDHSAARYSCGSCRGPCAVTVPLDGYELCAACIGRDAVPRPLTASVTAEVRDHISVLAREVERHVQQIRTAGRISR